MDEFPWALCASALATGLVFGFVTQRGGFCLTRAISNAALMGDTTILRAYVLALLVAEEIAHRQQTGSRGWYGARIFPLQDD